MKPKHTAMIVTGMMGMAIVVGTLLLEPNLWWLALILAGGFCIGLFIVSRTI